MSTTSSIITLNGKSGAELWKYNYYYSGSRPLSFNLLESIYDFDSDGELEILTEPGYNTITLISGKNGYEEWYCYLESYTINTRGTGGWSIGSFYSFHDVDSDGYLEIFYFGNDGIFALNADNGKVLWYNSDVVLDKYYANTYYKFKFIDLDFDNNLEIICCYEDNIYVINSEDGTFVWNRSHNSQYNYVKIYDILVEDIDNDYRGEIIYSIDDDLYAVNGEDGSIVWQVAFYDEISIMTNLEDLDNDGKFEIILFNNGKMKMINCEDGSFKWQFAGKDNSYLHYDGMVDIDQNGNLELVLFDDIRMYVLNPATGNVIWDFTTGKIIYNYHIFNYDKPQLKNIVIFSDETIYMVNRQQMYIAMNINPVTVKAGDVVSFTTYLGYYDTPLAGIELKLTDFEFNGQFSNVTELFPGVYEFAYIVPETSANEIEILLEAYHPNYYGLNEIIKLTVSDTSTIPDWPHQTLIDPSKDSLTFSGVAVPETLAPGESTTVFFKVLRNFTSIFSNLTFHFFDNNANGVFSEVTKYSNDYFTFTYKVAENITTSSITLLILISHQDYSDGLGIIKLNITTTSSDLTNETINETVDFFNKKLNFKITPYPAELWPGDFSIIMINITSDGEPITSAILQPFDNIMVGIISNIVEYGGGHYSFIYKVPDDLPKSISSVILYLYFTHENYSTSIELIELLIHHTQASDEAIDAEYVSIDLKAYPNRIYSGEPTTLEIQIIDESGRLDFSDIKFELSDNDLGGRFFLLDRDDDDGKFVYRYIAPSTNVLTIKLDVVVRYRNTELIKDSIVIERIPNKTNINEESIGKPSNDEIQLAFIAILFLILLSGILIGVFGLSAYLSFFKKQDKKSEKSQKELKDKLKTDETPNKDNDLKLNQDSKK